jgi:hypothetical protein
MGMVGQARSQMGIRNGVVCVYDKIISVHLIGG